MEMARASAPIWSLGFLLGGCFSSSLEGYYPTPDSRPPPDEPPPGAESEDWSALPSSEEVDEILAQPVPSESDVFRDAGKTIEHWTLTDPPSTMKVEGYAGDNWGATILAENVGSRASIGMTCVARQLAEFMDLHGELPSQQLQEFVLARCGSMVGHGALGVHTVVVDPGKRKLDDATVRRSLESAIRGMLTSPRTDAWVGGAWYTGDEKGGLLLVAQGHRALGLAPPPMSLAGQGHVRLSGKLSSGVESIMGVITAGEGGFELCARVADPLGNPDRFTLNCPVRSTDPFALIEIVEFKRRRQLGSKVLTLFVSPDGSLPTTYESHEFLGTMESGVPDGPKLVLAINELRAQAQLAPLVLDEAQSTEVSQLMPHYLAASRDPARGELADTIALAIVSGRKVEKVVKHADFWHFTAGMEGSESIARLLAQQSMSPMARSALLDPRAQTLAVGIQKSETTDAVAFVLATYQHPDLEAYTELEAKLYHALDEARGRRSRSRARRYTDQRTSAIMDQSVGRLELGYSPSYQGDLAQAKLGVIHRRSFGFAFLDLSEDAVEWPSQLLDLEDVKVALRIGYYRPNGSNRVHELAFVVYSGS